VIWKALFGVLGLASLFYILQSYGLPRLGEDIGHLGWWAIPLALSFLPVVMCYAVAWLLVTPELGPRHLFALARYSSIAVAWNNLSPFVKALGEPVRAQMLGKWISPRAAARSVVVYNLVHIIGTLSSFVLGSLILLLFFPVTGVIRTGLFVFLVVAPLLIAGLFSFPYISKKVLGHRVKRTRLALAGFWVRWSFSKMRTFSSHNPLRFWGAAGMEMLARFVEGCTFYVSFQALGKPVPAFTCGLLDIGRALMDNIFFFVPYQVGSREGGIVLLAQHAVGVAATAAVSAAVFYRLVEIFWMGTGYLFWIFEERSRKSST
jgi:hypothetical protein